MTATGNEAVTLSQLKTAIDSVGSSGGGAGITDVDVQSYFDGKLYSTAGPSAIEYARLWLVGDFASLRIGVHISGSSGSKVAKQLQFTGFQMRQMLQSQGYDYHPCLANVRSTQFNEYAYIPGTLSFAKESTPWDTTSAMSGSAFFSPYNAAVMSGSGTAAVRAEYSSLSSVSNFSAIMSFDIPVQKIQ